MAEAERPESSPKTRHTAQELKYQFEVFWIMCLGAECRRSCVRNDCVNPFPVALGRLSDAGYSLTPLALLGCLLRPTKLCQKLRRRDTMPGQGFGDLTIAFLPRLAIMSASA